MLPPPDESLFPAHPRPRRKDEETATFAAGQSHLDPDGPAIYLPRRMGFDTLGLSAAVLEAIEESGYTTPTPIQAQAIPLILAGRDLIGASQTGT